ncbi:MAG: hypothetical protein RJA36_2560 [Pseudomonadota bacterium]|jgi:hypothetical protein
MIKHAIAAALAVIATHSAALSLGGTQGYAIIGRPLDLVVRSSIDSAEAVGGLCLEAELLYGDIRVPASAVSVAIQKLGSDGSGALRVRSSLPVNEPVVTLVLKAGCSSRFTRSYVLLADYLQQAAAAAPVRELATPRVQEVLAPVLSAAAASAAPRAAEPGWVAASSARKPVERESPIRLPPPQPRPTGVGKVQAKHRPETAAPPPGQSEPAAAPAPKVAMEASSGSRLKLDLVDLDTVTAEREKGAAPAVLGQPVSAPSQERTQAEDAASPAAGAEPAVSGQQRMADMVRELEGLRSEQEKMRAAVEAVNAQLAQASRPRYLDPLVLGLLGVCGATLSALAWLWTRLRRQQTRTARLPLDEAGRAEPW